MGVGVCQLGRDTHSAQELSGVGSLAMEIEWNSKDPVAFADAWTDNFVSNKFGQATTHWEKLIHRVERGVGNPCPLLLIGLPASLLVFDQAKIDPQDNAGTDTDES